ncbi:MAG: DNA integrity scanning diadenylate cyclase DisA [Acidimicrobiales bacterium]
MAPRTKAAMIDALSAVAPGRPLRDGVDRILQASMGALIVVGDGPDVLNICSGGFLLDAEFSPPRLSELAKMDGAIILSASANRIARANVHLVPDPSVPTSETGTRHRTAERVARSIDVPVISVSEDRAVISVYRNNERHLLEAVPRLIARSNVALQTLERYKQRMDAVAGTLTQLEVEDLVTVRDVVTLLQRAEMVRRIAEEIDGFVVELGVDGLLIVLQLEEMMAGVDDERRAVVRDYSRNPTQARADDVVARLAGLSTERLLDLREVASVLTGRADPALDAGIQPRGYRLLSKVPRLPESVLGHLVERFGTLPKILRASMEDLDEVEGVGETRARSIKEGLARLVESSVLERLG